MPIATELYQIRQHMLDQMAIETEQHLQHLQLPSMAEDKEAVTDGDFTKAGLRRENQPADGHRIVTVTPLSTPDNTIPPTPAFDGTRRRHCTSPTGNGTLHDPCESSAAKTKPSTNGGDSDVASLFGRVGQRARQLQPLPVSPVKSSPPDGLLNVGVAARGERGEEVADRPGTSADVRIGVESAAADCGCGDETTWAGKDVHDMIAEGNRGVAGDWQPNLEQDEAVIRKDATVQNTDTTV